MSPDFERLLPLGMLDPQVVVTADTQSLSRKSSFSDGGWMDLMAVSVLHWAQRHGYGYSRYRYSKSPREDINRVCKHPVFGDRHASWCKLLVVAALMKSLPDEVEEILWLDSDTLIQQVELPVDAVVNGTRNGCLHPRFLCNELLPYLLKISLISSKGLAH